MDFKLYQGDCLGVMPWLPDGCADMILCDLPYGTTRNKWDSVIDLDLLWAQYTRLIKSNGAVVLFAQTPFDKVLGSSKLDWLRYEWIWEKEQGTGHLNANKMPLKSHENILVFYKELPIYNPQFEPGKPYTARYSTHSTNYGKQKDNITTVNTGFRYPKSVIKVQKADTDKHLHPTQKPVALLEYLIRTYTKEGDTVLDNTMGSGSTGAACMNTGRNFIGIELDPGYFETAKNRIEAAKREKESE